MIRRPEAGAGPAPEASEYFRRALVRGRLAHAYLLLGPEAESLRAFAFGMAKRIHCPDHEAHGLVAAEPAARIECASCRSIEHGNHAGVELYEPPEGKRVVDIESVRLLCERSHYSRDHAFVAILDLTRGISEPAANALLKTLEEPAGEFLLVLLADAAGSVLPTIVSRCHRLYVPAEARPEDSEVDLAELETAWTSPSFATLDLREWLERVTPGLERPRERLRAVLDALIRTRSEGLGELAQRAGEGELDRSLGELELFLALRADLEANVNPDLLLEKLIAGA